MAKQKLNFSILQLKKMFPWQKHTEVPLISFFDIGTRLLPDDEWSRWKCSLKGLQYMMLKVPTIMTAVGVNKDTIGDGINGYHATTDEEWFDKISLLINRKSRLTK